MLALAWQELIGDRLAAEAALQKTLGTLRYLKGLKAARDADKERQEAAGPGQAVAGAGDGGSAREACPVCHDPLAEELVMMPCGHALCHPCSVRLTEVGHASPRVRNLPPSPLLRTLNTVPKF